MFLLVPWPGETGFLFCGCSSGLEASVAAFPEHTRGSKGAEETHCHVVPHGPRSPGSPPSTFQNLLML